jgi:hypothetical protein
MGKDGKDGVCSGGGGDCGSSDATHSGLSVIRLPTSQSLTLYGQSFTTLKDWTTNNIAMLYNDPPYNIDTNGIFTVPTEGRYHFAVLLNICLISYSTNLFPFPFPFIELHNITQNESIAASGFLLSFPSNICISCDALLQQDDRISLRINAPYDEKVYAEFGFSPSSNWSIHKL